MRDQVTGNNKFNSFNVCSVLHIIFNQKIFVTHKSIKLLIKAKKINNNKNNQNKKVY